ncbi:MFS transporter [Nocardioides gansuensis]|uniref:MFS transporter n=1 Tax=Nocardioides gansuensis TaxID=2138300 RepID=A0A2T8FCC2_9ACTN|nr:MFS transporter [Nocardioides gansuensis]PVG83352.1 MFS transporter [Nocardioides gansuensis]
MTGSLPAARTAVMVSFFLNGFGFATWVSRIPEVREGLGLSNGGLGLLLFAIAAGSVLTLPTTGTMITRWGADRVVRIGVGADTIGLLVAAVGAGVLGSMPVAAAGLFAYGLGIGVWDVAMNVEGAAVERGLGRTIMPRFHAAFSLGTVAGAALGVLATALDVSMVSHLGLSAAVMAAAALESTRRFLPRGQEHDEAEAARPSAARAWLEPRTVLIGLMVFALGATEGTANDWLAVALIDGYDVPHWQGVAGFGLFVAAMTAGRVWGTSLLDRHGRTAVLWTTMAVAASGVLLIVLGGHPAVAVVGIVMWGLGASLGFPVGMSAAADDPRHAAVRVSVVSTIAYTAFLAGPPLLGFLADRVGTLPALLAVAVLLVPSALLVPAARERVEAR